MAKRVAVWWIRHDLRLHDNPALHRAMELGEVVLPLFAWAGGVDNGAAVDSSPESDSAGGLALAIGGATQWWLSESLESLRSSLEAAGSRLYVLQGTITDALDNVSENFDVAAVVGEKRFEPSSEACEDSVADWCQRCGIDFELTAANNLAEPGSVRSDSGNPMRVFTPFWRRVRSAYDPGEPLAEPDEIPGFDRWKEIGQIDPGAIAPAHPWTEKLGNCWEPGEPAAHEILNRFYEKAGDYGEMRDCPADDGSSRLSPYLHFGEISVRAVWCALSDRDDTEPFLRQLAWRDFAHHLLGCFPDTLDTPMVSSFEGFPWKDDEGHRTAWLRGKTGYPIVDAGMRELWETGWMHNRVRMIVASFLTKHLLLPWRVGADWFEDTLVDADLANNTLGWQWVAGCGADAAPYFLIFNPILQGKKFDKEGRYVRRWVPELADLPDKFLHEPWSAPGDVLEEAGVTLGEDYPHPIIEHAEGRKRALEAYETTKS